MAIIDETTVKNFEQILAINNQIAELKADRDVAEIKVMKRHNWDYPKFENEYIKWRVS